METASDEKRGTVADDTVFLPETIHALATGHAGGKERGVLVVGGVDPTGGAGVFQDIKTLSLLGVRGVAAVSTVTVQNTRRVEAFEPLLTEHVREQMYAVAEENDVTIVKTGLLPSGDLVRAVAEFVENTEAVAIVDPVLSFTAGGTVGLEVAEAYVEHLLPKTYLLTPNFAEGKMLADVFLKKKELKKNIGGIDDLASVLMEAGANNVLIKGGHGEHRGVGYGEVARDVLFMSAGERRKCGVVGESGLEFLAPMLPVEFHGTGCALASLIAGFLALGEKLCNSVMRAKRFHHNLLLWGERKWSGMGDVGKRPVRPSPATSMPLVDPRFGVEKAARRFCEHVPVEYVPEVGTNIAFALPWAIRREEVAGLDGRITKGAKGPKQCGRATWGGARHTARIVLTAMRYDPSIRCALNIAYSEEVVERAISMGFTVGSFSRRDEPDGGGSRTMEWGTAYAIEKMGSVPDIIYDTGGHGKEPMIRVLARDPTRAMDIVEKLVLT